MPFKKGNNKASRKTVSAASLKVYRFAAAAADKKLAAAELALASTPSVENQHVLEQARAAASAAHKKLERAAAPEGGNTSEKGRKGREAQINGTAAPTLPRFDDSRRTRRRPILPLSSALAPMRGIREGICLLSSKLCAPAAAPHTQHRHTHHSSP